MRKTMMLFLTYIFIGIGLVAAQTRSVTGVVTSAEDGQPVVGASVLVKGTTLGTITDIDGKFQLSNVPSTAKVLQISYIGMKSQEVAIAARVNVKLQPDAEVLDEVMVVAFGTAKKSAFTGSAAVVNSETISKRITSNVTDALVGSVPGLQLRGNTGKPGSTGTLSIRGQASMYAGKEPLVIVDGSPYPESLSNIPHSDIESISVLKDAASAALYGARGAAGVIIVTTKSGKEQKAKINIDAKWGVNTQAIPEYETIDDPGQYYEAFYKGLYNYFISNGSTPDKANASANSNMIRFLGYNIYTLPDGEQLIGLDGKLNPKATLGRKFTGTDGKSYYLKNDDWHDLAYHNALRQEYTVSLSGGTNKLTYYSSLGYLDEDGIIDYADYKRFSARFKADYQALSWLKVGANADLISSKTNSNPNLASNSLGSANLSYYVSLLAPIYPAYVYGADENGNPYIMKDANGNDMYDYGTVGSGYTGYGIKRGFMSTGNPLGYNKFNQNVRDFRQLNSSMYAEVQILPSLKFNATSSYIWGLSSYLNYKNPYYGNSAVTNGEISRATTNSLRTNHVQTLNYANDFGSHSLTALLGHEYYRSETNYLDATKIGGFSPEIRELNAFSYAKDANSYRGLYNVEGFFASAQYDYDDKYFASASYRRDASSRFAKDHRWGNFWSVGGAWIINKDFLKDQKWIDLLKVKLSIGQQGNDNIGDFSYVDTYTLQSIDNNNMGSVFRRIGNPNITWETTTNTNIGLEFELFKGRLNGSLDYYTKKTTNLLFWLSVPESNGSRGYYGNIGDIRNSGVEFSLTGAMIRTKKVDWTATLNLSHNSTKILSLPDSKISDYGGFAESSDAGKTFWYEEGGPLYNAFYPSYAGVNEKGQALYWVDENVPEAQRSSRKSVEKSSTTTDYTKAGRYTMGSLLPDLFGGFNTSLRVGRFDASLSLDFQLGGRVHDYRYQFLMRPTTSSDPSKGAKFHKDILKAWSAENPNSNIPRWQFGDQYAASASDRFFESASYLNFQSFTVGYTLPNFIKGVSKLRVYAAGENLGFISARKGLDPRFSFEGTDAVAGYVPVRNISAGVQISF